MIHVTRLNGLPFLINAELIEQLEQTPDTVIVLTSGTSVIVKESVDQVMNRILEYRRAISRGPALLQPLEKG